MSAIATTGPVLVLGTGLLGTSLALALRAHDVEVQLSDTSPTSLALARDMGAGLIRAEQEAPRKPRLVVVATPPDVAADVAVAALSEFPEAIVTDVASVKHRVWAEIHARIPRNAERYVGSHPMAGRERSGAGAADADLFMGRPWVIVPTQARPEAVLAIRQLAMDVGATPILMGAGEHDEAVAAVSHVPQLLSSLTAARLKELSPEALSLAGQGLRDTTRIAASDPRLWSAIVVGNAGPVHAVLSQVHEDLGDLLAGLDSAVVDTEGAAYTSQGSAAAIAPGAVGAITDVMTRGNEGHARIPGKHGGAPRRYAEVQVLVPDEPGELGRLFVEAGAAGVNIEDLALEHSAGQPVGIARLSIQPLAARALEEALEAGGWRVVRV